MAKFFYYNLSKVVFKWSLIYFLVLIFLEDVKQSFVTSHFSPHLIIPLIVLSGLVLFFLSDKSSHEKGIEIRELNRGDIIVIIILSLAGGLLAIKSVGITFMSWVFFVVIFLIIFKSSKYLWQQLK